MPQPPAAQCLAETQLYGDTQICGKATEHVDSTDASRRAHHDPETGARWPSRPGDTDPLAAFVHYQERSAAEGDLAP
jgi:hypothetical protein